MAAQHHQDTLEFALVRDATVVNNTVRIAARVTARLEPGETPEALSARVREAMNRLVAPDGEGRAWAFSNVRRGPDATGGEIATLTAAIRAPEAQNQNLVARAAAVSERGLAVSDVEADPSTPRPLVERAVSDLRARLAADAIEEARKLSEAMRRTFRVHRIAFAQETQEGFRGTGGNAALAASSCGGGDDEALGNAQRVTVRAMVTLAAPPFNVPTALPPTGTPAGPTVWRGGEPGVEFPGDA